MFGVWEERHVTEEQHTYGWGCYISVELLQSIWEDCDDGTVKKEEYLKGQTQVVDSKMHKLSKI